MRVAFGSLAANSWGRRFLRELSGRLPATLRDRRGALARTRDAAAPALRRETEERGARQPQGPGHLRPLLARAGRLSRGPGRDCATRRSPSRPSAWRSCTPHQGRVRLMTRVLLWFARDPAGALSRSSLLDRARKMYGSLMEFGQEATGRGTDLIVTRCAFHRVLRRARRAAPHARALRLGPELDGRDRRLEPPGPRRAAHDHLHRGRLLPVPVRPRDRTGRPVRLSM